MIQFDYVLRSITPGHLEFEDEVVRWEGSTQNGFDFNRRRGVVDDVNAWIPELATGVRAD